MEKKAAENGRDVYHGVFIFAGNHEFWSGFAGGSVGNVGTLITAEKVWFEINEETQNITMFIERGYVPATQQRLFEHQTLQMNLFQILRGTARNAGDRDLRSDALLSEVKRGVHQDPPAARYTVHRRSCFALMPFLLAPIGFCIGVLSRERGRMLALSFCLIPLAVMYLSDFVGGSLMRHHQLPIVGWLPAVVVGRWGALLLAPAQGVTAMAVGGRMDRYVAATTLGAYVSALMFLIAMFVVFDILFEMSTYLRVAQDNNVGVFELLGLLAEYHLLQIPFVFVMIAPFVTVIATMFALSRLMAANEITPMLFTGRSLFRILRPMIAVALMSAFGMGATWQWVIPSISGTYEQLNARLRGSTVSIKNVTLPDKDNPRGRVFCRRYIHAEKRMEGVIYYDRGSSAGDGIYVEANAAVWTRTPATGSSRTAAA